MRPPAVYQCGRAVRPDDAGSIAQALARLLLYAFLFTLPCSALAQERVSPASGGAGCVRLAGRDVADALEGRLPGLDVLRTSGQAGAGARLRLRGQNSLFRSSEPLVFVDGVRVSPTIAGGPSVLDLLSPEEVQLIVVLRGPAAAALYGTDAGGGVILVYTQTGVRTGVPGAGECAVPK